MVERNKFELLLVIIDDLEEPIRLGLALNTCIQKYILHITYSHYHYGDKVFTIEESYHLDRLFSSRQN